MIVLDMEIFRALILRCHFLKAPKCQQNDKNNNNNNTNNNNSKSKQKKKCQLSSHFPTQQNRKRGTQSVKKQKAKNSSTGKISTAYNSSQSQ